MRLPSGSFPRARCLQRSSSFPLPAPATSLCLPCETVSSGRASRAGVPASPCSRLVLAWVRSSAQAAWPWGHRDLVLAQRSWPVLLSCPRVCEVGAQTSAPPGFSLDVSPASGDLRAAASPALPSPQPTRGAAARRGPRVAPCAVGRDAGGWVGARDPGEWH